MPNQDPSGDGRFWHEVLMPRAGLCDTCQHQVLCFFDELAAYQRELLVYFLCWLWAVGYFNLFCHIPETPKYFYHFSKLPMCLLVNTHRFVFFWVEIWKSQVRFWFSLYLAHFNWEYYYYGSALNPLNSSRATMN